MHISPEFPKYKLVFGCDEAGQELKDKLVDSTKYFCPGVDILEVETNKDYPKVASSVADIVLKEDALGVLICGTGLGMAIAANKKPGIRAVTCSETYSATMARNHNDANILCLGARVIGFRLAESILDMFIHANFDGDRHALRVNMIKDMEGRGC